MSGMIGVRDNNPSQYFGLVAKINENNRLEVAPLSQQHLAEWYENYENLLFDEWWGMQIIKINNEVFTRKDLILSVANKDGGAHIDRNLPLSYLMQKIRSSH